MADDAPEVRRRGRHPGGRRVPRRGGDADRPRRGRRDRRARAARAARRHAQGRLDARPPRRRARCSSSRPAPASSRSSSTARSRSSTTRSTCARSTTPGRRSSSRRRRPSSRRSTRRVEGRPLAARAADPARREPAHGLRPHVAAVRVAALADVHGNAAALEAVLVEVEREQPDLIVSCGDLTWGALPRETVALLEPWRDRVRFVRGNSERELLERKLRRLGRGAVGARAARRPGAARLRPRHALARGRRRRRARPDPLLSRLPAQRRGMRDRRDAGRAGRGVHGRSGGDLRRHGAHAHAVRPARGGDAAAQPGQRRPAVRARRRGTPTGRCSARRSSCGGRRTTSRPRSSGCAPRACRSSSRSRS